MISVIFHFPFCYWFSARFSLLIKTLFVLISVNDSFVQILHKGKVFYKHYNKLEKTYWRCRQVNAPERCLARLCTDAANVVEINDHNHWWVYRVALGEQHLSHNKPKHKIQINWNIRECQRWTNLIFSFTRSWNTCETFDWEQNCDIWKKMCFSHFRIGHNSGLPGE